MAESSENTVLKLSVKCNTSYTSFLLG